MQITKVISVDLKMMHQGAIKMVFNIGCFQGEAVNQEIIKNSKNKKFNF